MTKKQQLHSLVDSLPDQEVHTVLRFVEYLCRETSDPVSRAREAMDDDESVTAEDLVALEMAEQDVKEGRIVSHAEARHQLLGES